MTTNSIDTQALALALAEAKKPCKKNHPGIPETGMYSIHCMIPDCTGEVYVLGAECRVECDVNHVSVKPHELSPGNNINIITKPTCAEAGCLGYTVLDPHDMRWMPVVREVVPNIGLYTRGDKWHSDVFDRGPVAGDCTADTPWDALLMAAAKALGLEAEA